MKPAAARSIGLTPGEVTLVITDLQGSTELWEWNPQIMDIANDLHAQLARRLLKTYCGYEVKNRQMLPRDRNDTRPMTLPQSSLAAPSIYCSCRYHGISCCEPVLPN